MKNILIPTDFSDTAWNAIKYALHLFEQETCTFHLLHTNAPVAYAPTINSPTGLLDTTSWPYESNRAHASSEEALKITLENIKTRYPNANHEYNTISTYNFLVNEINDQITKQKIDLVLMGYQGTTGTQGTLFGSHTFQLMQRTICPLLALPNDFSFRYIDDILFPNDYKHPYTKNELSPIVELAHLNEAIVHTLHIANEPFLSKEQQLHMDTIHAYFSHIRHDFKEVPEDTIAKAITTYSDENNIGLLAMTRRKHSFLERLLSDQKISIIGMHLKIPFLVLPIL